MIIATHPVSPEEVMEYLDGELSTAGAEAIRRHIDTCAECAGIADQFRAESQSLEQWNVPAIPEELDRLVHSAATEASTGKKLSNPKGIFMRAAFWSRGQWALRTVGALATLGLLLLATIPLTFNRSYPKTAMYEVAPKNLTALSVQTDQLSSQDHPAPGPPPLPSREQESKELRPVGMAAKLSSPPPSAHTQGDVISGGGGGGAHLDTFQATAPMIARTASLSITVKDFAASRANLDAILARRHGYAAELTLSTPENSGRSFNTSLRIPQAELTAATADLRTLGRVEFEKQSGEEVTQQHADLVARLKNSREEEPE
jgi:DNA-binding FrmR family transcriptional regulator